MVENESWRDPTDASYEKLILGGNDQTRSHPNISMLYETSPPWYHTKNKRHHDQTHPRVKVGEANNNDMLDLLNDREGDDGNLTLTGWHNLLDDQYLVKV